MEFVPYRSLRNEPADLRRKLKEKGELIVTVDGKPFAVMIDLPNDENMEDVLLLLSRLRAQMSLRAIRSQARRDGLDSISEEQAVEIVSRTRREKTR
jgi:hypothetical protein